MENKLEQAKAEELIKKTMCLVNDWNYEWAQNKTIEEIKKDRENPRSWHNAKRTTLFYIDEILKAIPMYTGNLNPKWKFYNDVKSIIEGF
ncbi:hypothetical protein [Seonamhaeicola sp.]|uniref:hypothetical protein n=1 Tax=Seonamhaeicola sp. TaxID=1912245 RepID=UPI003563BE1F